MEEIKIVGLINVKRALDERTLRGNIFLSDNSHSPIGEHTDELVTCCSKDSRLTWVVEAEDRIGKVSIESFSSSSKQFFHAIPEIIDPKKEGDGFSGFIKEDAKVGMLYQYSFKVKVSDGEKSEILSWDPFITILK